MTDDAQTGSHPNVIRLRPARTGKTSTVLTHDRLLRIKMRMAELKMDQAQLSAESGLSNSAISQIFKQKIKATRYFPIIAKALRVNLAWLLCETDQRVSLCEWKGKNVSEQDLPNLLQQSEFVRESVEIIGTSQLMSTEIGRRSPTVDVPEIDMTQAGRLVGGIHVQEHGYIIGRSLIEAHTRADPVHVMVAQGIGDAMEPVLNNTDLIFIDTSRREIHQQDVIWLIRYAGMLMIRRVRMTQQGALLMAANPVLPEQLVDKDHLEVLGRVVGSLRKF